jgi:5-(carboxyamino)imidazole ribonucleotide synthase
MLNYPLGNTAMIMPSIMINILGANGYAGEARAEGLEEVLTIPNAFVHLYGKRETKPGRKMGHATVISHERQELIHQANRIRTTLSIKGSKAI